MGRGGRVTVGVRIGASSELRDALHQFSRRFVLLALFLVLCTAAPAHAQTTSSSEPAAPDESQLEQARKLFEEGLAHVEAGDWVQAEQAFRRVLVMRSSPVVAYNLASALARLGRLIECAELLRAIVRDNTVDAATREPAQHLLLEIEPQIGSLTVRVVGNTEDLVLRLDQRTLGAGELVQAISVDPGVHTIAGERAGKLLASEEVKIGGAAPLKAEVTLDLREKPMPQPKPDLRVSKLPSEQEPEPERDGGSAWSSPWLWSGAAAVVLLAAGIVTVAALSGGEAQPDDPIAGDSSPPVIRGRVLVMEAGGP